MKPLIVVCFLLIGLPEFGNAQEIGFSDTHFRQWSNGEGQDRMRARLIAHDPDQRMVYLEDEDQTRIEIPFTELSISDRRYIARQMSRINRLAKREQHRQQQQAGVPGPGEIRSPNTDSQIQASRLDTRRSGKRQNPGTGTRRLYGIDWHQQPESASQIARGKAGASDDKPVIWFRVLGDLEGFM